METTRYNPRDPTEVRKLRATRRLETKVALLEGWFQGGGPPKDAFCPRRIGEFLAWEDESIEIPAPPGGKQPVVRGVFRVTAVTADRPENKALKGRALYLMGKLAVASKPVTLRNEVRQLKAERDEARVALKNITNRYVEVRQTLKHIEDENMLKANEIQNLMEERNRLAEELRKVKPFTRPQKGE